MDLETKEFADIYDLEKYRNQQMMLVPKKRFEEIIKMIDSELTAARGVIRIAKENTTGLVTAEFMKALESYDKARSGDEN